MMTEPDQEFLRWIRGLESWYERSANRWQTALFFCQTLAFMSSFIAIVTTAATTRDTFEPWGKAIILAGTLLGALSSEMLGQLSVRRMEDLRESGHLEISDLYALARDKFDEFGADRQNIHALKDEIRERIRLIEQAQHRQFVDINAAQASDSRGGPRPGRGLLGGRGAGRRAAPGPNPDPN